MSAGDCEEVEEVEEEYEEDYESDASFEEHESDEEEGEEDAATEEEEEEEDTAIEEEGAAAGSDDEPGACGRIEEQAPPPSGPLPSPLARGRRPKRRPPALRTPTASFVSSARSTPYGTEACDSGLAADGWAAEAASEASAAWPGPGDTEDGDMFIPGPLLQGEPPLREDDDLEAEEEEGEEEEKEELSGSTPSSPSGGRGPAQSCRGAGAAGSPCAMAVCGRRASEALPVPQGSPRSLRPLEMLGAEDRWPRAWADAGGAWQQPAGAATAAAAPDDAAPAADAAPRPPSPPPSEAPEPALVLDERPGVPMRLLRDASVTETVVRDSELLCWLDEGTVVVAEEVVVSEEERRVRARLAPPHAGWISLRDLDSGSLWAASVPQDPAAAQPSDEAEAAGEAPAASEAEAEDEDEDEAAATVEASTPPAAPSFSDAVAEAAEPSCETAEPSCQAPPTPEAGLGGEVLPLAPPDGEEEDEEEEGCGMPPPPPPPPPAEAAAAAPQGAPTPPSPPPTPPSAAGEADAAEDEACLSSPAWVPATSSRSSPRSTPAASCSSSRSMDVGQQPGCREPRARAARPRRSAAAEFVAFLREKGDGSAAVGWRRYFDSHGRAMVFAEFSDAAKAAGFPGDAAEIWVELVGTSLEQVLHTEKVLDEDSLRLIRSFGEWCKKTCGGLLETFDLLDSSKEASPISYSSFVRGLRALGMFSAPDLPAELTSEATFKTLVLPLLDPWKTEAILPEAMAFFELDPRLRRRLVRQAERARERAADIAPNHLAGATRASRPRVPHATDASAQAGAGERSAASELLGGLAKKVGPLGGRHWKQGAADLQALPRPTPPPVKAAPKKSSSLPALAPMRGGAGVCRKNSKKQDRQAGEPASSAGSMAASDREDVKVVRAEAASRHRKQVRNLYKQKNEASLPALPRSGCAGAAPGPALKWHGQRPPPGGAAAGGRRALDAALGPPGKGQDFFSRGMSRNLYDYYSGGAAAF